MRYWIAIFCLLQQTFLSAAVELLSLPERITEAELQTGAESKSLDMRCSLKDQGYFRFETYWNGIFFEIALVQLPDSFTETEKFFFIKKTEKSMEPQKRHLSFLMESPSRFLRCRHKVLPIQRLNRELLETRALRRSQ